MNDQILYTTTLKKFIDAHLGRRSNGELIWENRDIDKEQADVLFQLTNNEHTCFIQFNNEFGQPLARPIVWEHNEWLKSTERRSRIELYSHKQRVERFLLEDNVGVVTKALCKLTGCTEEQMLPKAYSLVKQRDFRTLSKFSITKLKEKEEEL